MSHTLRQSAFLSEFRCTGPECPDTCCKAWNMQLDPEMYRKYESEKPELLDAVATDEDGDHIMRRDPKTDYCVKFEDGLCGIHKKFGDAWLGDACHFYPRATRQLGTLNIRTATPSCPEVARLALFGDADALGYIKSSDERLPYSLKDYLPEELSPEAALKVHESFIAAVSDDISPEQALLRISSVARSMARLKKDSWPDAVAFYLKSADARIPPAETKAEDPFNLVHALCGLIVASRKHRGERLMATMNELQQALGITLDWNTAGIAVADDGHMRYTDIYKEWQDKHARTYEPVLRNWLKLQLAVALFPFSGLGDTPEERITIIGVRYATFRLALMCGCGIAGSQVPQDVVVRIAQTLARVLDHLANAKFSLNIYGEVGWTLEARLRGLIT